MIIIDTNVLSELLRPTPAAQVEAWLSEQDGAEVYFTSVGEAELRYGLAILPLGRRHASLSKAINNILDEDFATEYLALTNALHAPMQQSPQIGAPRVDL